MQVFPGGEGLCLSMDPSNQFGQGSLMSHLNELSNPFLNQPFHTSIPIDRSADLLREKILDLLSPQRRDRPVIGNGEFGWTDLDIFLDILNLFS